MGCNNYYSMPWIDPFLQYWRKFCHAFSLTHTQCLHTHTYTVYAHTIDATTRETDVAEGGEMDVTEGGEMDVVEGGEWT